MQMQVFSTRIPSDLLQKVRTIAHFKSIQVGVDVRTADVVRLALERFVREETQS
jgi:hypothetical protein